MQLKVLQTFEPLSYLSVYFGHMTSHLLKFCFSFKVFMSSSQFN